MAGWIAGWLVNPAVAWGLLTGAGAFIWAALAGLPAVVVALIVLAAVTLGVVLAHYGLVLRDRLRASGSGDPKKLRGYSSAERRDSAGKGPEGHLADGAMQEIREIFERSERKKRDLVEAELVLMIEEGNGLKGNAFGDEAAPSDEVLSWRESVITFIGFALGDLEKQRLLEVEPTGHDIEGTLDAILHWLRQRRDDPASWEARARELNGPELDAAIEARRGQQPESLADQLDDLIREGRDLLDELMAPAQAEETRKGYGGWNSATPLPSGGTRPMPSTSRSRAC